MSLYSSPYSWHDCDIPPSGLPYVAPCSQGAIRPALLPTALLWPLDRSFISQEALQRTHYFFVIQDETGSVRISVAPSFYAIMANPLFSQQGWRICFLLIQIVC